MCARNGRSEDHRTRAGGSASVWFITTLASNYVKVTSSQQLPMFMAFKHV